MPWKAQGSPDKKSPLHPGPLKSSLLRRSGAKECKLVARPTPKFWQIWNENTRLFQLNKYLLSCCYVQQGTILGSAKERKMNNAQMPLTQYLAESLAPLPLHLLPLQKEVDGRSHSSVVCNSFFSKLKAKLNDVI